jgi:hypothetical protein
VSAPLVINLKDGSVWERRAVTAAGVALYALAGSCKCPEFLMASESELAAQGIAGTADVLPVPVGPEPQVLSVDAELAAYRALELGTAEGRVSAKCEDSQHPVWLRDLGDVRGCPWCRVVELERTIAEAPASYALMERARAEAGGAS